MTVSEKDEWAEKEANAIVDEIILGITGNAARLVGGQPLIEMPLGERLRKFAAEAERRGYERGMLEAKAIVTSQEERFGDRKHFTKYTASALEFAAGEIQSHLSQGGE